MGTGNVSLVGLLPLMMILITASLSLDHVQQGFVAGLLGVLIDVIDLSWTRFFDAKGFFFIRPLGFVSQPICTQGFPELSQVLTKNVTPQWPNPMNRERGYHPCVSSMMRSSDVWDFSGFIRHFDGFSQKLRNGFLRAVKCGTPITKFHKSNGWIPWNLRPASA